MNIYIFTDIPDSLNLAIACDTLRGQGHAISINPSGEISAHDSWILLNFDSIAIGENFFNILNDPDLNIKVGIVGKHFPNEFQKFLDSRFEHFSSWDNLIYKHL